MDKVETTAFNRILAIGLLLVCAAVQGVVRSENEDHYRRVTHISDGTPSEQLIIVDGHEYKEVKELMPEGDGRFIMVRRLVPNRELPLPLPDERSDPLLAASQSQFNENFRAQPLDERLNEKVQWYIPGGQPDFPKLIYSLKHGWKEISNGDEFRRLNGKYTAPRGLPGLRWIEVPYDGSLPRSRTRVAIPSSFVPIITDTESTEEIEHQSMRRQLRSLDSNEIEIPSVHSQEPKEIEIPSEYDEGAEENGDIFAGEGKTTQKHFAFTNKATASFHNLTAPTTSTSEKLKEEQSDIPNVDHVEIDVSQHDGKSIKDSDGLSIGDVNYVQEGDLGAVISSGDVDVEAGSDIRFVPSILGELVAAKTESCSPIAVRGEEGEPLYWIVRALPCSQNPEEKAKIFTTDEGESFAYYGRPELVSLRKKKF